MSQKSIDWAYSNIVGFPEIKFVLVILAMDANDAGRGQTTLAQLARDTEVEERRLPGMLHSLENFGLAHASVDADGTISFRLAIGKPGARPR